VKASGAARHRGQGEASQREEISIKDVAPRTYGLLWMVWVRDVV